MRVIAKHKSGSEILWTGGAGPADDVSVMLSVAQLLQHAKDDAPWAPRIIEIRIEME